MAEQGQEPLLSQGQGTNVQQSSQHNAVKYFFCIFGVLYAAWGISQIVLTFTGPCAARWSVSTFYRGAGGDDLDLGEPYEGQYAESQFSMSFLFGLALIVLGISYFWQQWSWNAKTSPWDETRLQVHNRFRPSRWVTYGIFYALIFAAVSFYAGVLDVWLVAYVSVMSIPLHLLQSQNEADNTDVVNVKETKNVKGSDVQYLSTGKNSVFESSFVGIPRIESWLGALVIHLMTGLVWFFHLGYANSATTLSIWTISIPIVVWSVYFLNHVFILFWLTNYRVGTWDANPYYREWFFIAAAFVNALYPSIVAATVAEIDGGGCSS